MPDRIINIPDRIGIKVAPVIPEGITEVGAIDVTDTKVIRINYAWYL